MAEQEQNRNEAATPHKLEEARKRGSVPKSLDVNSLCVLVAAVATLHLWGAQIATREMSMFGAMLSNAHQTSFAIEDIAALVVRSFSDSLALLAPLFIIVTNLSVLGIFSQTGPVFSFFPLKPDFDRVNPISGFKRIFSMRLVFESIKTILKFTILSIVLYYGIQAAMPVLLRSLNVSPTALGRVLLPQASGILFKLIAALVLITVLDAIYSRWDFFKRLRMSRHEIGEEHKRREGDPRIKSRLRELQREAVKRAKSLSRVKEADVLITNPTHLAVAIKYEKSQIDAPVVVAKGAGFLASRMRKMARRHQVPVIENRRLARAIFHAVSIDHVVPNEHYNVLAKILVWVYALKTPQAARGVA